MMRWSPLPVLFLWAVNAWAAPDTSMSITPSAVSGTTITASDENSRNSAITTAYNAHSHAGLTVVDSRVARTAGNVTTTSTSLVDLTGASITLTTGANPVVMGFCATTQNSGAGNQNQFVFDVDGTAEPNTAGHVKRYDTAGGNYITCLNDLTAAVSAASHTFKVRWNVSAGTGTVLGTSSDGYLFWVHEIND